MVEDRREVLVSFEGGSTEKITKLINLQFLQENQKQVHYRYIRAVLI